MTRYPIKIAVTGASGYLGARLSDFLLKNSSYEVAPFSRSREKFRKIFPSLNCYQLNLNDVNECSLDSVLDVVIHLAATDFNDCQKNPVSSYALNVIGTKNLLAWALEREIKHFIYFSSIHVYGSPLGGMLHEKSPLNPVTHYAKQKMETEQMVLEFGDKHRIPVTILRLSNAVGWPLNEASSGWDLVGNFLCRSAITNNRLEIRADGKAERNFITVSNLLNTVDFFFKNKPSGIFNVGSDKTLTILDLMNKIQKIYAKLSHKTVPIYCGKNAEDLPNEKLVFNIEKLQKLGIDIKENLDNEIEKTLNFLMAQG